MDVYTIAAIGLAIGAGSIVKGATGIGLPLVAVPSMVSLLGLHHAIAIMVVPVFVSNMWQLVEFRSERSNDKLRFLGPLVVSASIGVVAGTFLLTSLESRTLTFSLGLVLLAYLVSHVLRPAFVLSSKIARYLALPVGIAAGIVQGATGVSAPLSVPFVQAMRLECSVHVFALSAIFLTLAIVQWPALYYAGVMRSDWVLQGVVALIPMFVFMPIGQAIGKRMTRSAFDKLVLLFLVAMCVKLLTGL